MLFRPHSHSQSLRTGGGSEGGAEEKMPTEEVELPALFVIRSIASSVSQTAIAQHR